MKPTTTPITTPTTRSTARSAALPTDTRNSAWKLTQRASTLGSALLLGASLLGAHAIAQTTPNFGSNVIVINPGMTPAQVNSALNQVNQEAQFSTNRWQVLFLPGSYGSTGNAVYADVGYYEAVAGLGQTPGQVTITGGLVADQLISGNLTQNFWRSQENLTEVPVGGETNGTLDWGVSQGASLRRLSVQGNLSLVDSSAGGSTCAESSGGFTADTAVTGVTNACSQQQWYTRNSTMPLNGWQSNVWNFVFSGVTNAPAQHYPGANPGNGITTLATTPVSREKPFLYVDASGNWFVFSPAAKTNSSGVSWTGGLGAGSSLPISAFFLAQPTNTLAQINQALASGKNLILTPGIYKYSGAIAVTNPNTVVLGMGYATLVPQSGTAALTVGDVDGVQVAGLLIDAGPVNSPALLEVGNPNGTNAGHGANPTSVNDVFFRIGGATAGTAGTSLQVDSGNAILDNIWAWRADHGNAGTVGWSVNTAAHGVVVNGDNVTALGLAVEHYQQAQVQWNGNGGETIFYQSELPYDVPSQSAWMDGPANGYPSYVVGSSTCTHTAYGLGIYSFFNQGLAIVEDNAMTVPNVTGVNIHDVGTVWLGGSGQISNVIDNTGGTASSPGGVLVPVANYLGSGSCGTAAPAAPTNFYAVSEPASGSIPVPYVALSWNASTTPNVTYTIYRASGGGAATVLKSGVTALNYNDQTISGGTTYTYYVVAVSSGGTPSPASNSQTLTTGAAQIGAPSNLTGVVSGAQIKLNWTASSTSGVTYTVYRATGAGAATALQSGLTSTSYTDSAVTAGTTYSYDVVAAAGGSLSPQSNTVTVTAGGGNGSDVIAIDAGSSAAVGNFIADTDFTGGGTYAPGQAISVPAGLAGAAPAAVYANARQGGATYTLPNLTPGSTYTVRLHFAELYFAAAGQRQFNVAINGTQVLSNFDIYAAAGNAAYTAVVETFANITPNASNQIVITLSNGAKDQPMINGVELLSGTAAPPPPPSGVSIDSGSTAAVSNFVADTDFTGGGTYAPGQTVTVPAAVTNAAPEKVYESARQGGFTYTVGGLAAGSSHTVTLHFAELYFAAAGQRLFNVQINGSTVLSNFDIYATAGNRNFTAVTEAFPNIAPNASNQIVITFSNGAKDQPMVNGVVVQ